MTEADDMLGIGKGLLHGLLRFWLFILLLLFVLVLALVPPFHGGIALLKLMGLVG